MDSSLKQLRLNKQLTQLEASKLLKVSLRSYKDYENDESKFNSFKYDYLLNQLSKLTLIDEEHGILSLKNIKSIVTDVLKNYNVNFCILFGSYAKGKANDSSDVDLLIDSSIDGIDFYGLVEELRTRLSKKIDLLNLHQLNSNEDLLKEILKDGIKIYG